MIIKSFKLTGCDKTYYHAQLIKFEQHMIKNYPDIVRAEYGKQDNRGSLSISLVDDNGAIHKQRHFKTKDELLGFVIGYNLAKRDGHL